MWLSEKRLGLAAFVGILLMVTGCGSQTAGPPAPDPKPAVTQPSQADLDSKLKAIAQTAALVFTETQSDYVPHTGYKRGEVREIRLNRQGEHTTLFVDWNAVGDTRKTFLSNVELPQIVFYDEFLRLANHPDRGNAWREIDEVVVTAYTSDTKTVALQTTLPANGLYELSKCQAPGVSCGTNRPLASHLWSIGARNEPEFLAYWQSWSRTVAAAEGTLDRTSTCPKCDRPAAPTTAPVSPPGTSSPAPAP